MNAPRQGIYAALLASSFALHAVLLVQGTMQQQANNRLAQGALLQSQLAVDVLPALAARDTVGLALLLNRYAERLDIAQVVVRDVRGQVLATSGRAPTRGGEPFVQNISMDQQPAGTLQLTLIEPSRGEVVRQQWLPLLLSLLLHGLLWWLYRVVARPAPSAIPVAELPAAPAPAPVPVSAPPEPAPVLADPLVLQVAFDDPRHLLDTLSPSLAEPYFLLCQTLLERSIATLSKLRPTHGVVAQVRQRVQATGAVVGITGGSAQAQAEFAVLLASLLNLLTETVYRRHRESKHFALYTKVAIAAAQAEHTAQYWAEELLPHVKSRGVSIHVDERILTELLRHYPLRPFEHPLTAQLREAMQVEGLGAAQAELVGDARAQILGARRDNSALPNPDASSS